MADAAIARTSLHCDLRSGAWEPNVTGGVCPRFTSAVTVVGKTPWKR